MSLLGPFDNWWDILGAQIQPLFAWSAFNRDAFADNVGWRQAQKYQKKNYNIAWTSVARDDIRDMMSISVNRLNNFMVVNGLMLGVAATALTYVPTSTAVPKFLIAAFIASISSSLVFLGLAIMFGIKGQNCAFTRTMRLLTFEMRPENPADYNHNYMEQAQWIETLGLTEMFRIPGIMPNYQTHPDPSLMPEHMKHLHRKAAVKQDAGKRDDDANTLVAEDLTPLEHLQVSSKSLWYLMKFAKFMSLWLPYDTSCKYAMGMGMLSLGHAGAYFIMASIEYADFRMYSAASVGIAFTFAYMVALVVCQTLKDSEEPDKDKFAGVDPKDLINREVGKKLLKLAVLVLLCLGPVLGVWGATTEDEFLNKFLWIGCYFFHLLFWSGTCWVLSDRELFAEFGEPMEIEGNDSRGDHGQDSSTQAANSSSAAISDADDGNHLAGAGTWPTDDPKFEEKVAQTREKVRFALRNTVFVIALVWMLLLFWVLVETIISDEESPVYRVYPAEYIERVNWPSPFLKPRRISCAEASEYQFIADDFRVFKLHTGIVDDFICNISTRILDLSSYCEGSCWPVVLQEGNGILDCQTGSTMRLLQEASKALLLDVHMVAPGKPLSQQRLIAVHEDEKLVQYQWSDAQGGWQPEMPLDLPSGARASALQAIDTSGNSLMLFYGAEADHNTIIRRDVATMRPQGGPWALTHSAAPLLGGCATNQARNAFVLPRVQANSVSAGPAIISLDFQSTHGSIM